MYFTSTESDDDVNNGPDDKGGSKRKKDYIVSRNHDHYYGAKAQNNNMGRIDYLDMPNTDVYRKSINYGSGLQFGNQKSLNSHTNNRNSLMIPGLESNYTNQDHSPLRNGRQTSNHVLISQERSPTNSHEKPRNKSNSRNPSQNDHDQNTPTSSHNGHSPSNQ
jgi:hypothetical protein